MKSDNVKIGMQAAPSRSLFNALGITAEEMKAEHSELPHGGFVIRTGSTGFNNEHKHVIEYSLQLDSNPEFTGSVLVALARAASKMHSDRGSSPHRRRQDSLRYSPG